jgi:hypothetical protein
MAEFDTFRYEQEVLRPLRRRQGPIGDAAGAGELAHRYGVEPGMDAPAIAARLGEVRAYWRRRAAVPDSIGEVCADLLQADADLRAGAGAAMFDAAWWSGRSAPGSSVDPNGVDPNGSASVRSPVDAQPAGSGETAAPTGDAAPPDEPARPGDTATTGGGPAARPHVAEPPPTQGAEASPTPVTFYRKWPAQTRRMLRDELLAAGGVTAPERTVVPVGMTAAYDSGAVVVSWTAAPGGRYRVVRAAGPVTDPGAGRLVGETGGGSMRDPDPAIAEPLGYTLFRDDTAIASVTTEVLPPVTAAAVVYGSDRVRVSWAADPVAVAVRVSRRVGAPPASPVGGVDVTAQEYDDPAGMAALPVYYGLTAVYPDGRLAAMVVVAATSDDLVSALRGVTIGPAGGSGDRARVRMSWPDALGDAVRVYRCDRVPPAEDGEIDPTMPGRVGVPVEGDEVPTGYQIYLPVLAAGARAWAGPVVALGIAEPVDQVEVERAASAVRVTWQWPPEMTLAQVEWSGGWRRITRAEYRDRNGCALPDIGTAREVRVIGVTVTDDGDLHAAPVAAPVPARRTRVRYEIRRGPLYRPGSRILRLTADADCDNLVVTVYAVRGEVMPLDPPPEAVVATVGPVRLAAGEPETFPLSIPVARPYWIVCRAPEVELMDPPVEQMKVV